MLINDVYKHRYTSSERKAFSDVIKKASRAYEVQITKNCAVRVGCLEMFARQKFTNINLFWALYMQRADVLLNSRRFIAEAKSLGLDAVTLATNIVAHGASEVKKVANFGIVGSRIKIDDYNCNLVPAEIVKRFSENPEEFYPETDNPVSSLDAPIVNPDQSAS